MNAEKLSYIIKIYNKIGLSNQFEDNSWFNDIYIFDTYNLFQNPQSPTHQKQKLFHNKWKRKQYTFNLFLFSLTLKPKEEFVSIKNPILL